MTDIAAIISEVASIAATLEDHPLSITSRQDADGIEAMQQAASAFTAATTDAARLDAALCREAAEWQQRNR